MTRAHDLFDLFTVGDVVKPYGLVSDRNGDFRGVLRERDGDDWLAGLESP